MPRRLRIRAATLLLLLAAALRPGYATSAYTYGPREYVTVADGRAPNGRLSVAAHGRGEDSADDFGLYLTTAHGRRRPVRLPAIGPDNTFDHGAQSYRASWSPDSRRVAVTFRIERHVLALRLYVIRHGRPHLVGVPDIVHAVLGPTSLADDDLGVWTSTTVVTWLGPRRFRLDERRLMHGNPAVLLRALHGFGRRHADHDPARAEHARTADAAAFVTFAATAICTIGRRDRVRIARLKAGPFN
jgi:hypothetical protein